jgi:dTDP-4-dehydrorhamnose 3,5-epimerase
VTLSPLGLDGVLEIVFPRHEDERGSFQRSWCRASLAAAGLGFAPDQSSLSVNPVAGTLRGMHYQAGDAAEHKLVRCVHGAVFDVALDLRPGSSTYGRHVGRVLDAGRGNAVSIPRGCAHGFLTLTPDAVVEYLIEGEHVPAAARGCRWDDPFFAIAWPGMPRLISERDRGWPLHG